MFGNKDNESGQPPATSDLDSVLARLGALPLAELANQVIAAMAEVGPTRSGLVPRTVIVATMAPGHGAPPSQATLNSDAGLRQLHLLVAEGLQVLQNAGLVCLVLLNEYHFYSLTRLGEDAVSRGAVMEVLQRG